MVDTSKLQFYSGYPIDKIVVQDTQTFLVPKPGTPGPGNDLITLRSIINPYQKKGYSTLSYSLDGVNFYDQAVQLAYYNATFAEQLLQISVKCACNDSLIYFVFTSNFTADQNVTVNYTIDTVL